MQRALQQERGGGWGVFCPQGNREPIRCRTIENKLSLLGNLSATIGCGWHSEITLRGTVNNETMIVVEVGRLFFLFYYYFHEGLGFILLYFISRGFKE